MAAKKPKAVAEPTPEAEGPTSAPELPRVQQREVPQLIKSTKSTKVEPLHPEAQTTAPEIDKHALSADTETEADALPTVFTKPDPIQGRPPTEEELESLNEHWQDPGDPDGVHAEDQRQRWREQHPVAAAEVIEKKKRHPWRNTFITLLVIAGATYGVYWAGSYIGDRHSKQTAMPAEQTPVQKTPAATAAPTTKQYDSTNFNLSLSYPAEWKLTDTATKLTIASPSTQLTLVGGTKKSLHVLYTIQPQQATITGYPAEGAVANLDSDKLTYTKPTPNQRAQTYVSYLGFGKANGLDAVYVTGDYGYLKGQAVPMSNVVQGNPLVSVTFATCTTDDCSTGTPVPQTLLASSWPSASISKAVASLLESIQLD